MSSHDIVMDGHRLATNGTQIGHIRTKFPPAGPGSARPRVGTLVFPRGRTLVPALVWGKLQKCHGVPAHGLPALVPEGQWPGIREEQGVHFVGYERKCHSCTPCTSSNDINGLAGDVKRHSWSPSVRLDMR